MSTPTVKITVTTAAVVEPSDADLDDLIAGLHMLYVQATKDDKRYQFVLFPQARKVLGVPEDKIYAGDPMLLLRRKQEFPKNRSKWFHHRVHDAPTQALQSDLAGLESRGYTLSAALAVPLEQDDYIAAWSGETPHKAMRAIGRALKPLGIDVK